MFNNLRSVMATEHITQKSLAAEIGICEKAMGQKLCGEREFTRKEMLLICEWFAQSLDYFFGQKS